jgi:hypothetical protein
MPCVAYAQQDPSATAAAEPPELPPADLASPETEAAGLWTGV